MSQAMRCLSVRQPFAWALVVGAKDIENRSWTTEYRGPVVIHASATRQEINRFLRGTNTLPEIDFTFSAFIGVVDLVDVLPLSEALESNPWAYGPYCWRVQNPRVFPRPVPAKGKLQLFEVPADLADRIGAEAASARPVEADDAVRSWVRAMTSKSPAERDVGLFQSYLAMKAARDALRLAEAGVARAGTSEAYVDRARAKLLTGGAELPGALDDLNRAIKMEPSSGSTFYVRSAVYAALADADYEKAIELNPALADDDQSEGELEEVADADESDGEQATSEKPTPAPIASREGRAGSLKFQDLIDASAAQIGDELELIYQPQDGALSGTIVARLVSGSRNGLLLVEGGGMHIPGPGSSTGLLRQVLEAQGRSVPSVNGNLFWRFRTGRSAGKTLWDAYEAIRRGGEAEKRHPG